MCLDKNGLEILTRPFVYYSEASIRVLQISLFQNLK